MCGCADMWVSIDSQSEKEQQAAKRGDRKSVRALRGLAKPFTGQSTKKTELHIRAFWRTWNDEETQMIKAGIRGGIRAMLESPEGRRLDPDLRSLLQAGMLEVKIHGVRCEGVHGWLRRPSVKAVVEVAGLKKETAAFKVSRRGAVDFSKEPMELDLEGSLLEDRDASGKFVIICNSVISLQILCFVYSRVFLSKLPFFLHLHSALESAAEFESEVNLPQC
jgi:hypothetical protein